MNNPNVNNFCVLYMLITIMLITLCPLLVILTINAKLKKNVNVKN